MNTTNFSDETILSKIKQFNILNAIADIKLLFRWMYDKLLNNESALGNFIPLTGTTEGNPVTGDIELNDKVSIYSGIPLHQLGNDEFNVTGFRRNEEGKELFIGVDNGNNRLVGIEFTDNNNFKRFSIGETTISINGEYTTSDLSSEGFLIRSNNPLFKGFYSLGDFSEIEPENKLIYAQRSYVDKANSYSTDETLTGGTWIDGKPIYRKVLVIDNTDEHENGTYILLSDYIADIDFVLPNQLYYDDNGGAIMASGRFICFNGIYVNFYQNIEGVISIPATIGIMTFILEYTKTTD